MDGNTHFAFLMTAQTSLILDCRRPHILYDQKQYHQEVEVAFVIISYYLTIASKAM